MYGVKFNVLSFGPRRGGNSWRSICRGIYISLFDLLHFLVNLKRSVRACLHGNGGPQVGEATRLSGVTHLSIKSLILLGSRLHDSWGDPPRWVARSARPGDPLSRVQSLHVNVSRWVTRLAGVGFGIHQIGAKFILAVALHHY